LALNVLAVFYTALFKFNKKNSFTLQQTYSLQVEAGITTIKELATGRPSTRRQQPND
jgi:hypothetical protein